MACANNFHIINIWWFIDISSRVSCSTICLHIVLELQPNVYFISAFYHDSAACLLKDGNIIAAAQEERFTRKKHDANFPHYAIKYCEKCNSSKSN